MNSLLHLLSPCNSEVHSAESSRAGLSPWWSQTTTSLLSVPSFNAYSSASQPFPALRGMILILDDDMPRDIIVNGGEHDEYQDSLDSADWIFLTGGLCIAHCICASHAVSVSHRDTNIVYRYRDHTWCSDSDS